MTAKKRSSPTMKISLAALAAIVTSVPIHFSDAFTLPRQTNSFLTTSKNRLNHDISSSKVAYLGRTGHGKELTRLSSSTSDIETETSAGTESPNGSGEDSLPQLGKDGLYKIENKEQHLALLKANPDKIVILKFYAPWCRACKGLEPKFLQVKNDERYEPLPLVFADLNVQNNRDYVKALGVLALPNVHIYAGADGLVENFPCGPSKVPILKKKIAAVVNERVNPDTYELMLKGTEEIDCDMEEVKETEPCMEREITDTIGDELVLSEEKSLALRKIPYFNDFTDDEFNTLIKKATLQTFESGSVIMRQGKKGERFFVIDSGEVEISIKTDYDDPLITPAGYLGAVINVLSEGDWFGERALITGEPRAASIRAVEKTRCFAFNRDDIPSSSVLSGKKSATKERIDQVNDKYGVDTYEIIEKGLNKQIDGIKIASQTRGSVNRKGPAVLDTDEDKETITEKAAESEEASSAQIMKEVEFTLPKKDIVTLLVRFRNIRRAARCFEYIAETQPKFGDVGEKNRRAMLVSMLTPEQVSDFKATFDVIDKSHDKLVSLEEMREFMQSVGAEKSDKELLEIIDKANPVEKGNTEMTFDEFMGVMAEAEFYDLFNDTFNALDQHNSGFVRAGDLDRILDGLRDLISNDRKSLIDTEDKDILINYEQFSRMLLGIS